MQRIKAIKDLYLCRDCLIIGGGRSFLDFEMHKLPDDIIKISINDSIPECGVDYMIYSDNNFIPVVKKNKYWETTKLICFSSSHIPQAHYFFNNVDVLPAVDCDNTGLKAIIIARKIMGFNNIYLTGFDFYYNVIDGKKVSHWNGDRVGKDEKYPTQYNLDSHYDRLSKMVEQFDKIADMSGVWNCNHESALTVFPFGLPWECGGRKTA